MRGMKIDIHRARSLLSYEPETGLFRWIARAARNTRIGAVAGRKAAGRYVDIGIDGRLIGAHRLAWMFVHGEIAEGHVIDHINGDPTDNRISNLRLATPSQNLQNRHRPGGANPVVGVTWDKHRQRWRADIKIGSKCVTLGRFVSISEAMAAHSEAKRVHHGIWPELATQEKVA